MCVQIFCLSVALGHTKKNLIISCCASGNVVHLRLLPGTQVIPVLEAYFQTLWNNFLYQILNFKSLMVQLMKRNQSRAPPFLHPDGVGGQELFRYDVVIVTLCCISIPPPTRDPETHVNFPLALPPPSPPTPFFLNGLFLFNQS